MVTPFCQCPVERWPLRFQYQRVRLQTYPWLALVVYVLLAFRAPNPADTDGSSAADIDMRNPSRHVYSRYTQQVSSRVEHILSRINVSDVQIPRIVIGDYR